MTILETICFHKRLLVDARKQLTPISVLHDRPHFQRKPVSMKQSVLNPENSGIIAEFKRQSPSKGIIHALADVHPIIHGYTKAKASGISVLTDTQYFGGCDDDLLLARAHTQVPLLRKDFIIDTYQIIEAKSLGADCILLIAACLDPIQIQEFTDFAHSLGLEVLLELHDLQEAHSHMYAACDMVGVNNRNLKTFHVDLDQSILVAESLPANMVKIAESGLQDPTRIPYLKSRGFQGFLIGENFMKTDNPGEAMRTFVSTFQTS